MIINYKRDMDVSKSPNNFCLYSCHLFAITWLGFSNNLVPVILGKLVGGSVLVGVVYHIYRRGVSL